MVVNASAVDGEEFFQQEPLIVRLKNLIHDYPEGLGIIKELIQNADDAGAKRIDITLDWRTHAFERLPDERMAALMGPAILVYNDAVFSDADFENIKNLGVGGKKEILWKTGRFGVGFNSVYHITDYPSFISRDRIVLLDPHGSAIPETSLTKPGRSWRFGAAGWWDSYPDFLKVYEPGGLEPNQVNFQGTLFRLPLRTEEHASLSQIRKQPFTREKNIEPILQELADVGEELLLFLKSVLTIRVQEILGDGTACELLSVKTINQEDMNAEREELLAPLKDSNVSLLELCQDSSEDLPAVSYLHQIETSCPDRLTKSTWRIASLLRVDKDGELIEVIEELTRQGEKAVPWAGAAARIACESTDEDEKPFVGRAYCFLPLPQKTGLPIHLNGFFDLDSSRRELTSDETLTGRDESRVLWNQLLVRHVVTYACANLISSLIKDIGEANPKEYYKFWPVKNLENSDFEKLPSYLIQVLDDERVIRVMGEEQWTEPSQVWVLPTGWQKLSKPLIADRVVLPNPTLPKNILDAFEKADLALDIFKPQNLREHLLMDKGFKTVLAEAPRPSLRNPEWVVNLLRYCLDDGCRDIEGLPLAIFADGTLQVFGHEDEFLYIADEDEREIFADYPEWFLSSEFVKQIPEVSQCNAVTIMSAQDVAERLADVIDSDQLLQHPWQPDAQGLPNATWLTQIYRYFSHQDELPSNELKVVPLVPGNDGRLHQGGTALTPLWCSSQIDSETLEAINYFKVPLVQGPKSLMEAIAYFLKKHPDSGLIWEFTALDLVDTLHAQQKNKGLPLYNAKHYNAIINFFCRCWQSTVEKFDENRKEKISELTIFLTAAQEVIALNEADVYISSDYEPPSIAGQLKLLCLGPVKKSQIWRDFFKFLDITVLDRATLIRDCLLPDYSSLDSEEQLLALEWIRDNLSKAQTELEAISEDPAALENEIANADLIHCTDANLRPTSLIYDPNEEVVRQIFGDAAPTPNMEFYAKGRDRWLKFFRSLGMLVTPSASDLLNYVDGLIQQASQSGTASVSKACMTVYYHIETYWDKLITEDSRFSQILKTKAWLPVECREEELKQYPGACIPENRLYRPNEVSFIQDVHLVASQRPLFRVKSPPKKDIQEALAFHSRSWKATLNHFKVLIDLWETKERSNINQDNFRTALETIYKHLASICLGSGVVDRNHQINEPVKVAIYNQLANQKCLWKEDEFWKPEHAFRRSVPFFGKRRVKIDPSDSTIRGIYEFLGQKAVPETSDYIAFLNEVYEDAENSPLGQEDVDCVIKTLNQLTKDLSREEEWSADLPDLLLLTEDLVLLPADEVWVPDAHWRLDGVRKCGTIKLLHPNINPEIAQLAGSPSLLEADEVSKQPVEISQDSKAIGMCLQWQQTLRTQEFTEGIERLIWHEYYPDYTIGTSYLEWLQEVSILPADKIVTDLYADDQLIALDIPGDQHYDSEQCIFYLRYDSSFPEVMVDYLGEGLTIQLDKFTLSDRSALIRTLNTDPRNISSLLDNLRIRSLPKMNDENEDEDASEAEKDHLFSRKPEQRNSSNDLEEKAQEVEQGISKTATSTEAQSRRTQRPTTADSSINQSEFTVGGMNASSTIGERPSSTGSNCTIHKSQSSEEGTDDRCDDDDEEWNNSSSQDSTRDDRSRSSGLNYGGRGYQPSSKDETNEVRKEFTRAGDRHRPITSNSETYTSSSGTNDPQKSERTHTSEHRKTASGASNARSQQYRLRTYVNSSQAAENDPEDQYPQEVRDQIDCAGMKRVLEYERSQGRSPKEMPKNHPGYDIESTDNSGLSRFIEVKSSRDYWGLRGVKLSRTQFQIAQNMGEDYWLYVVERAEDNSESQIFKIQNPALRVEEFYYDAGWQEVATADEA